MCADPTIVLRAGSTVITPSHHGPLAGFVARGTQPSHEIYDDLQANLIWLSDAQGTVVAWLSLDVVAVPRSLTAELTEVLRKALGAHATVLICASHTHSAPTGWVGTIHPGNDGDINARDRAELIQRVAALADRTASQTPIPVRVTAGSATVSNVATDRNNPSRPTDQSTATVMFTDRHGDIRAVIFDFGCHPTVLGANSFVVSADWVGAARAALQRDIGSVPVVFLQGAAGGASTRFTRTEQTVSETRRLGERVADAILRCTHQVQLKPTLRVHTIGIKVPCRQVRHDPSQEAQRAMPRPAIERNGDARLAESAREGQRVQEALARTAVPASLAASVTAVRLGEIVWIHLPVEPFSSTASRIRGDRPPLHARIVGYTNDYLGYLPDSDARTARTYEAMSSWFDARGEQVFEQTAVAALAAVTPPTGREAQRTPHGHHVEQEQM